MNPAEQPTGIFTTDTQLTVRTWNPWLEHATGITAHAAQGQSLAALVPDLQTRGLLARLEHVLATGVVSVLAPAFHQYLIRCAPQTESRYFTAMQQRVTIGPLLDDAHVVGVIVTIADVTARRERERDLAADLDSPDELTRLRAAQQLAHAESEASDALFAALGDTSWRVRQAAVGGLAQGGAEMVATLVRAMHADHQNPSVLNSALQVLARTPGDAVTPLLALLESPDADLRGYVALALGERGDPQAIPNLLGAIADSDMNVRYHVIEALGKLRARAARELLTAIAESGDFFLAFPALDALTLIGDPTVAPQIVPLLDDPMLAAPAAHALAVLGNATAIRPLAAALDQPDAPTLELAEAIAAIAERSSESGTPIAHLARDAISATGARRLIDALPTASAAGLRAVALVLGWLHDAPVQQALTRLLAQPAVRSEAIAALARQGASAVELLVAQLAAEDLETREAAVIVLGRIGSPQAVPALIRMLEADAALIIAAADALAKIGDRRAFEPLLDLLGHPHAAVRQAAIGALDLLGHPDLDTRILAYLDDPNPRVRESAVKIAGYFGYPGCVDLLLARCHDADEHVRRAAIEHVASLDDVRVLPMLALALRQEAPTVRAAAARALGQFDDQRAVMLLLGALDDADGWVRYYTARALGRHAAPEATGQLARLAQTDAATHVRIAALEALGQIGDERASAALAPFAQLAADELALPALGALGRIGRQMQTLPPALLVALHAPRPTRRAAAVAALAQIALPQTLDHLEEALDDHAAVVRLAAVTALRQANYPNLRQRLDLLAQSDPDAAVRAAAHMSVHL